MGSGLLEKRIGDLFILRTSAPAILILLDCSYDGFKLFAPAPHAKSVEKRMIAEVFEGAYLGLDSSPLFGLGLLVNRPSMRKIEF